jgi:putative ABC transport system substrate-binding protein
LWNPANPVWQEQAMKETETAGRFLDIQLQVLGVRTPEEINGAFEAMARAQAEALDVINDPVLIANQERIVSLATKARLPSVCGIKTYAEAGGLLAYGPDFPALYRRTAFYIDKILKGARPADLPIEQPTKFELVINLKTTKAIGLTVPPTLLASADEVIE